MKDLTLALTFEETIEAYTYLGSIGDTIRERMDECIENIKDCKVDSMLYLASELNCDLDKMLNIEDKKVVRMSEMYAIEMLSYEIKEQGADILLTLEFFDNYGRLAFEEAAIKYIFNKYSSEISEDFRKAKLAYKLR